LIGAIENEGAEFTVARCITLIMNMRGAVAILMGTNQFLFVVMMPMAKKHVRRLAKPGAQQKNKQQGCLKGR